jgi:hypothetical protein
MSSDLFTDDSRSCSATLRPMPTSSVLCRCISVVTKPSRAVDSHYCLYVAVPSPDHWSLQGGLANICGSIGHEWHSCVYFLHPQTDQLSTWQALIDQPGFYRAAYSFSSLIPLGSLCLLVTTQLILSVLPRMTPSFPSPV